MGDASTVIDEAPEADEPGSGAAPGQSSGTFRILIAAVRSMHGAPRGTAYTRFRQDPYFILNYYLANLALLIAGTALLALAFDRVQAFRWPLLWFIGLLLFVLPSFNLIFLSGIAYLALAAMMQPALFTPTALALVPAGMLAGTISAALMHNAAHGNFRPRWSNRPWGELCGLFQLTGLAGWTVSHVLHHASPDDPERDAHPPGTMSFRAYANAMGVQMKDNLTAKFFELHGRTPENAAIWRTVVALAPVTRYLRIAFILLLLGPSWFLWFYVPFKIVNALIYIDFNYRTHRPTGDGGVEVLNLDHTPWYKLLNAVSFGSYYHKNHHSRWNAYAIRLRRKHGLTAPTSTRAAHQSCYAMASWRVQER